MANFNLEDLNKIQIKVSNFEITIETDYGGLEVYVDYRSKKLIFLDSSTEQQYSHVLYDTNSPFENDILLQEDLEFS